MSTETVETDNESTDTSNPANYQTNANGEDVFAPFGFLKDGVTPRKSSAGRPVGAGARRPTAKKRTRARAARPAATSGGTTRPASKKNYGAEIADFLTMLAVPLAALPSEAAKLDSMALVKHAPDLGHALWESVEEIPQISGWAEKILSYSPHSKLATVLFSFGVQIAANHKIIPAGKMGSLAPDELAYVTLVQQAKAQGLNEGQAHAFAQEQMSTQYAAAQAAPDVDHQDAA